MSWLRISLGGDDHPLPHDSGSARARRIQALQRLLRDPVLRGGEALALVQEMRELELREALESLQSLQ